MSLSEDLSMQCLVFFYQHLTLMKDSYILYLMAVKQTRYVYDDNKRIIFFITIIVGAHLNRLGEAIAHNICFY